MKVVVVESPSKAKTINKYLGDDYRVLASYGHVRDLPSKDGSVLPDEDFTMLWEVDERADKALKAIAQALKGADTLYLATDPDREGEAISWHIEKVLRERGLLDRKLVKRVVFHEVTSRAIKEAFSAPRDLDDDLVEAYLARRALDYLVGFSLSPVLWRKLPGARSAGRVQSVALRLVCEREAEIEVFKPQEYWTVDAGFRTLRGDALSAHLTQVGGKKLDKFGLPNEAAATAAVKAIEAQNFKASSVEKKRVKRNPQPPFTTSTLQQEASRKLGLGASQTMRLAQRLYEGIELDGETVGLITYMRTDSVTLSRDAIEGLRAAIGKEFGPNYVPEAPRLYQTKAKNAQEAHEAIRPTDPSRRPQDLPRGMGAEERKLYDLIWRRSMAAEMASAQLDQTTVDLASPDGKVMLRATGAVIAFDGFLKLYREDHDDNGEDEDDRRLPEIREGEALARESVTPAQHFTQPPPRYSEASLVKKLEELGIGRPSTYASILQVLRDRNYVRLDRKRFIPEDRGRIVTAFLASFFSRYVEYDFTAQLEEQLDDISGGRIGWKDVLRAFWRAFAEAVSHAKELTGTAVRDALDEALGPHFFPPRADGKDPRACPACADGKLNIKLGRHGPFVGCANYPECKFTRPLQLEGGAEANGAAIALPLVLGIEPTSGLHVAVKRGPFGLYLQLGEAEGETKPKRVALPKGWVPGDIDFKTALALIALPREIGKHPEDGAPITAGIGRFGPYVKHGSTYASVPDAREVLDIGVNRAVALIADKAKRGPGRGGKVLRSLGAHPTDGKPVDIMEGRYGAYARHGKINATLPKGAEVEGFTLASAVELLAARAAMPAKPGRGKRGGKSAAPKATKPARTAKAGKAATATTGEAKSAPTKKTPASKPKAKKPRAKPGATG
ncbi:MAG: type I DNA topoisomerase [Alphaproteobacteria bacterium]|nr:type I DNA topoisomerase [Alphaproteobacteria bacterium]